MTRRTHLLAAALLALATAAQAQTGNYTPAARAADSTEALAAFRSNIGAIHSRDRAAYLRHYLQSPRLARTGPGGVQWGYAGLAGGDPDSWPDTLVATHFEVVPVAPGVVYGAYRYRVVQDGSSRGVSERVLVKQPDGSWKVAVSTAFGSPGDAPVPAFALTGATIVDGTGAAPRVGTVVMRDGRIACVGRCEVGPGIETIDARGKWIVPGLVDGHVHYSQTGWADGRPDALDLRDRFPYDSTVAELRANPGRFYRSWLCSGVTATFDVGGYPWTWELRGPAERSTSAPHVAAAGPLVTPFAPPQLLLPGTQQFMRMESDSVTRAAARFVTSWDADALKVWMVVGPTAADTAVWVRRLGIAAEEARRARKPLIVHATNLWAAKHALRAGAKLLVHSVDDAPVDEEFLRLAREAGTSYNPTLTVRDGYVQLAERRFRAEGLPMECVDPSTRRKAYLTDSLPGGTPLPAAARERLARGYRTMLANLKRVHDAGIPVVMGTDAGNPLTLHGPSVYREMEAMAEAGMTPMQVLVASTRNGARAMGRDDFGTLEPGKVADLVVLDADPLASVGNLRRVALVARGGEIWTREELEYR
ncbi:MAG: amidohydrolase family protein [Gemmatimonadota bacterium]